MPVKKILVADDEKEVAQIIQEYFTRRGFLVDAAFDGEKAIELIKADGYDIVFLDEDMPGLTGLEIAEYVKRAHPQVRVVIISGYPGISERLVKAAGVDVFLEKPVDLKRIEAVIAHFA